MDIRQASQQATLFPGLVLGLIHFKYWDRVSGWHKSVQASIRDQESGQ
jgi:hypothetical protein